jgi:hypothetical protein
MRFRRVRIQCQGPSCVLLSAIYVFFLSGPDVRVVEQRVANARVDEGVLTDDG